MSRRRFAESGVVVTGGGSGIGAASVRGFYDEGASVLVVDANQANAEAVAAGINDPERVYAVGLDVTDRPAIDAAFAAAARKFGRLNVLVNSAGIRGVGAVVDVEPELWERVHAVNLTGTLNTMQSFARALIAAKQPGAIVNVSSMAGIMGIPRRAPYVSSKHAVVGLTREMAMEVGTFGIRVNAVAPGTIRTPMTEVMFKDPDEAARMRAVHPIGREGRAEEVAAVIMFLASEDASFVTGTIVPVDGGWSAGRGW